jgi:hypothetical protein
VRCYGESRRGDAWTRGAPSRAGDGDLRENGEVHEREREQGRMEDEEGVQKMRQLTRNA